LALLSHGKALACIGCDSTRAAIIKEVSNKIFMGFTYGFQPFFAMLCQGLTKIL
jgi:hypothetical protein